MNKIPDKEIRLENGERKFEKILSVPQRPRFRRVGYMVSDEGEEIIYLCLCDGESEVIKITGKGFEYLQSGLLWFNSDPIYKNVYFENAETMCHLHRPACEYSTDEAGKSYVDIRKTLPHINDLRKYLNVSDEDFCLVVAWLLLTLNPNPNIDAPILWINGVRNTGKTTAMKILKWIIDPDTLRFLSQYMSDKEFKTALTAQYIVAIDNISSISTKISNMLCREVTDTKRHTVVRNKDVIFDINRHSNIIANSLNTVSLTPELQERCFIVKTHNISTENRLTNEEIETSFKDDISYILGSLLTAVCLGLRNKDYKADRNVNTRLLDAYEFVARVANIAYEFGFPFSEQNFIEILNKKQSNINAMNEGAVEDDLIAKTIYEMALESSATEGEVVIWNDTSDALRQEIEKRLQTDNGKIPSDFPQTPQKFGKRLTSISELLSEMGIYIDRN